MSLRIFSVWLCYQLNIQLSSFILFRFQFDGIAFYINFVIMKMILYGSKITSANKFYEQSSYFFIFCTLFPSSLLVTILKFDFSFDLKS